ncbi:hypothetical protein ACTMTF_15110 [Nonomuraea sp. ZG12]|uniref:hypothetical protein n=1 Tax=Nonomuraea sp. ZG12 TaxID=3452207 RepID=UPI003F8C293B
MILDKANEIVKIFDTEWVPDGYGGGLSPVKSENFTEYKAFLLPTGFAGAGWAVNIRYSGQGWADTARLTVIMKWKPSLLSMGQWTQVEAQGQIWTVVQAPRRWKSQRVEYVTVLVELKGDLE